MGITRVFMMPGFKIEPQNTETSDRGKQENQVEIPVNPEVVYIRQ
jgi:hypothetical protein